RDLAGRRGRCDPGVGVVWVVTSANHAGTRRNPLPGHRREALVENVTTREGLASVVVPVPDVAPDDRFAQLVLTSVATATGVAPDPADTVVACSTPPLVDAYRPLGHRVAGREPDAAAPDGAAPPPPRGVVAHNPARDGHS